MLSIPLKIDKIKFTKAFLELGKGLKYSHKHTYNKSDNSTYKDIITVFTSPLINIGKLSLNMDTIFPLPPS